MLLRRGIRGGWLLIHVSDALEEDTMRSCPSILYVTSVTEVHNEEEEEEKKKNDEVRKFLMSLRPEGFPAYGC